MQHIHWAKRSRYLVDTKTQQRRRRAAVATFIVALAATGASALARDFGPPFILSGTHDTNCTAPRVAINAGGDAVFTWVCGRDAADGSPDFRVRARTRSKGGVFGPILILSGRSVLAGLDPRPAIDTAGNALVAWTLFPKGAAGQETGPFHAQFRALSSAGVLGPIEEMSNVIPADSARVAMSPNGRAVFLWRRPNNNQTLATMETRTRNAAGVLGAVKSVSLFQDLPIASSELAMDAHGDAVFAWQRRIGGVSPHMVVQARRRSAAGNLGVLHQNLGTSASTLHQVAIDGQGNAIAAWVENVSGSVRVEMRTLSTADVLGPQQFISQGSGNALSVQVAMNAAGDAVFAYAQVDGTLPAAKARARFAAGGLTGPQTLSPSGSTGLSPSAAIDAHARSVFGWAGGPPGAPKAQARTRSATGALGAVQTLDNARAGVDAHVVMNPRGDAVAVWNEIEASGPSAIFTIHGAVTPIP